MYSPCLMSSSASGHENCLNLSKAGIPKCWISSNLPLFNYGLEVIQRARTFLPDKFKFTPFSTTELNFFEEWKLLC